MSLRLLGRVAAHDRLGRPLTIPGIKARALLALLAVRANHHFATDRLEDELWDGAPPRGARSTIQAHVCRLRSVLVAAGGSATLEGGAGGYELRVDPAAIDVHRFEALAKQGSEMLTHNATEAADLCARALDEWRGPALHDVRHVPALYLEAQRLDELRLATIETRLSAELEVGGHGMVVASLQRLVDEHPYRERMRGLLMVALYRSGRQVEAMRAYRAGYRALADIGVQPGRELRALEEAISREDPALNLDTPSIVQTPPADVSFHSGHDGGDALQLNRPVVFVEGPHATITIDALVEAARGAGRVVLRGRAQATSGRPYHCVVEAFAPLLDAPVDPELADALAPIVAAVPPTQKSDPAVRRFQVFEAVVELLAAHAAREPLVVVLEDIDEAGASTLDLIEHLARRRGDAAFSFVLARTAAKSVTTVDARLIRLERDGLMHRASSRTAGSVIRSSPSSGHRPGAVDPAELAADAFDHAARLSARAGDDALARLGFEEAAAHYRAALAAVDFTAAPSTVRRGELHLALGRACHAAYQLDDALSAFGRAASCASEVGDVHLLGEAAVGVATATEFGMADPETEALLMAALDALPDQEASARVELLAGLARTTPGNTAVAIDRARRAVELGRRLDTPRPLTIALATAILVTWGPNRVRSRLADIDEVIVRATDLDMVELAIEARAWRAATLDQLGLHRQAQIERAIVQQWAEHSRRPFFLALAAMMTISEHLQHGRIDAAEAALVELPSGADSGANFSAAFAAQLFLIRRRQQRVHEFVPLFDGLAGDHTAPAAWHAARIVALAETGDHAAGDMLEAAVAQLGGIPHDWLWLTTVTLLTDACLDLGDAGVAAELHRRLWPYRDHTVIIAHGIASLGPVGPRLAALSRLNPNAAASTWAHPTEAA
jgi:DNA-binding SARP family transcriptional activator